MSFERMEDREQQVFHERVCILLYHFTAKEEMQLKNIAKLTGMGEVVSVKTQDGDKTLREILDDREGVAVSTDSPKEKAIIFNGIIPHKVNAYIEFLKKYRIKRPLLAVVTEQSIDWQLKVVIDNLIEERSGLAQNRLVAHDSAPQ